MTIAHRYLGFAACFVLASSGVVAAHAEAASATKTFLTDYSKLLPDKDGKDLLYIAPNVEKRAKAYTHVMVDAPEVFISPESPYQGAKPQDIAAISGLVRDATVAALKERGYQIVDKPAANVIYVRTAITDLQIQKKKRALMAYTPAGFVVDTGLKAMQDFTQKYDVLDLALATSITLLTLLKTPPGFSAQMRLRRFGEIYRPHQKIKSAHIKIEVLLYPCL